MKDQFRSITLEDLIRRYNLEGLKIDRKRISSLDNKLTYTDGILTDFVEQTTQDIENIQDQLDGNITSWFYEGVPTLNNEPAVNWTTTALKDEHLGDLYYDTDAGTAYRFILDNGVYKWNLLQDDAAAQALAIARAAQDTADSKRRIFVVQPTPPYDVGDVWWNNTNNELYRCIVAETESGTFHSSDWLNSLKYTDDSTAIRLVGDLRDDVVEGYATKTALIETENSINASVKALRVITDSKHQIFETTPTPPYTVGDYYIDKTNQEVYKCITAKTEEQSYSSSDWVLDLELTEYVAQAGIDIFEDAINMEVKKKVGDDEIISKINLSPEQIEIASGKISLAGKQIKMTTDNITIASDHFNVAANGDVECQNLKATGADISGKITATSGTIGGASIVNGTLTISNINIDAVNGISADKIKSGILNALNIDIQNINGSNVNRGILDGRTVELKYLSADNIVGGSLTAGQINYNYYSGGQNFLRCGPAYAKAPYVSALNVAYGHGGISFRSSDNNSSPGDEKGYIKMVESNGNVRMYGNNGISIQSGGTTYIDGNNGANVAGVRFYSNYIHIGNLISGEDREINIGSHYINAGAGGQIDMHTSSGGNLVLYGGGKVRAGGNSSSNNVATSSSGPSSKNVKKNLKNISNDYKDVYEDLKKINMYTYDYKYDGIKDNKEDYGFIIDEIEDTKTLSKYFRNYSTKLYLKNNKVVSQSYSDEDMNKYDSLDIKEWERDAYIKGLFITIKSLQNEIEELKDEVKSLKERNGAE